jgi:Zn-finger protein
MQYLSFFKIILSGFMIVLLAASCVKEGPMGPAGADGTDGIDGVAGEVTCMACHEGTGLNQKSAEFEMSVHSVGAIAVDYAGGRASCAKCHSHEQFVQIMTLGKVAGDITNPSAWECSTCHGIHESFDVADYALRSTDPVTARFNTSVTLDMHGKQQPLCCMSPVKCRLDHLLHIPE